MAYSWIFQAENKVSCPGDLVLALTLSFPHRLRKRTWDVLTSQPLWISRPPTGPYFTGDQLQKCSRTRSHKAVSFPSWPSAGCFQLYWWLITFLSLWEASKRGAAVTFLQSSGDAASSGLRQGLPVCYIIYAGQIVWQLLLKYNHCAICTCYVKRQKFFKALIPWKVPG